ncbi:respiratory nitrate reductase subunit gamma [Rhodomicrobium vannielii ATCC 17100]|uniref:respiratory nitrate reductase subunit gamma n=1 Tax=Rhodomicrobium vannielii TaxID=1069 RepID=UPI00191AFFA7|nr:respiratory nitrate reductase subunit gamma [Rhodomicrobium vannielii ATCC 17100]
MQTTLYAVIFYVAAAIFAGGLGLRVWQYARTPVPLKIPTTPAPITRAGATFRVLREVTVFESLFKSNKWIWLFGWIFHIALALVLVRHLRYFTQPVWTPVALAQPLGIYAGFAMVGALFALWVRRVAISRMRYISDAFDNLILLLLLAIGATGLGMTFIAKTDIVALKGFFLGLMTFDWQPLPADPLLLSHLALVALLMVVFPFTKLLHAPGVFFSPSRNQADDARERRYAPRPLTSKA